MIEADDKACHPDINPVIQRGLSGTMVDGPHGGLKENLFAFEVAVQITAGVEISPFASILKGIWYRMNGNGSRQECCLVECTFFGRVPRKEDFAACESFRSLLVAIEAQDLFDLIEIYKVGCYAKVKGTTTDVSQYLILRLIHPGSTTDVSGMTDDNVRQQSCSTLKSPTKSVHPIIGLFSMPSARPTLRRKLTFSLEIWIEPNSIAPSSDDGVTCWG